MENYENYEQENQMLNNIFGVPIPSRHGDTRIIIAEYYTGMKPLKEQLLDLMINKIKDERNDGQNE